jgi:hypothetical protein
MERSERLQLIAAILTGSHVINSKVSENFKDIMNLYMKYYQSLDSLLPRD